MSFLTLARKFWVHKYPERELVQGSFHTSQSSPTIDFIYYGERGKTKQTVAKAEILLYCLSQGIINEQRITR